MEYNGSIFNKDMMEVLIKSNRSYVGDFNEILRAFSPDIIEGENGKVINVNFHDNENSIIVTVSCDDVFAKDYVIQNCDVMSEVEKKSLEKRQAKVLLYDIISQLCNRSLPYGSLTGIRPTKLYRDLQQSGLDAYQYFVEELRVSEENAKYVKSVVDNQNGIHIIDEHQIDLYVNIPICVSRCSYCSFISAEYGKIKHLVDDYTRQLTEEIEKAAEIIASGYELRAIYVGGGTPTSLNEEHFNIIMEALGNFNPREFTVEAGRPDTINDAKLSSMAKAGVTRISINPQSFNDNTLVEIGRAHTTQDIINIYKVARKYDFIINMDLISMLPGESFEDFKYSVDSCIALLPDNITIHTLAIKRGSTLKLNEYDNQLEGLAVEMLDYSRVALLDAGYKPYYMYRQKYMSGNLDNASYALPGKECLYNIDMMEESHNIIACGAGGMSKRVFNKENRLERLSNPKGIDVYLERRDKINIDKVEFFK